MDLKKYSKLKEEQLFSALDTKNDGLSVSTASQLLSQYGENTLVSKQNSTLSIFIRQFKSPFVYLLFAAFLLAAFIGQKLDASMMLLFILINAVLGFYQEYKSEQTVKLLKKYLVSKIQVVREGKTKSIDVNLLVPGDIVLLEPGDIVPADIRLIDSYNFSIDESALTGESAPVFKNFKPAKSFPKNALNAVNLIFTGTTVSSGTARGVVIATGKNTNFADIVKLTSKGVRESSFEKELGRFSNFTLIVVLVTLVIVIIASLSIKPNPNLTELVLFALALAVSVIPEALPVVTTFSLSIGALNLAKKDVVVKRLSSVEDLGGMQVLCTDKTGTLTENKLQIEEMSGKATGKILIYGHLASFYQGSSRNLGNNAFDLAIEQKIKKDKIVDFEKYQVISQVPFDPQRKRVSSLVKTGDGYLLITRGAPEEVVKLCRLSPLLKRQNLNWTVNRGKEGKRVLAVGYKKIESEKVKDFIKEEKDLVFCGLMSFIDPIKSSAYDAVKEAQNLNVALKILTGDSPEVAKDVALKVNLISADESVISGEDFEKMSIGQKHKAVENYKVFARLTPAQKYAIIKLLEEKYSVGFLGEGINDAPALKIANVAIVVDEASDVSKDAADIVLLKKDLKVILEGISGGRRVFVNTQKYIRATMASNFGNFFAVSFVALFIDFLPMLPLQILLVNLLSDFPNISIATDRVDPELVTRPRRFSLKEFALVSIFLGLISTGFDFIFFATFRNGGESVLQTYWFMGSIITEIFLIFSIRTNRFLFKASKPSKTLVVLAFSAVLITLAIPLTSLGKEIFGFTKPHLNSIMTVFAITIAYIMVTEVVKDAYFRLNMTS